MGGVYSWEGQVEIFLNGGWGAIGDYDADRNDAHVVCRQLGYDTRCKHCMMAVSVVTSIHK